tara:strand:- start:2570 stop:2770 length:201 start_codon:yes stop_codon:yes gene_type:complete
MKEGFDLIIHNGINSLRPAAVVIPSLFEPGTKIPDVRPTVISGKRVRPLPTMKVYISFIATVCPFN